MTKSLLNKNEYDDDDDEETQTLHAETNIAGKINDDESFDGMEIEDWLAKHSEFTSSSPIIDDCKHGSETRCDGSISLKSNLTRRTRPVGRVPSQHSTNNNNIVTERVENDHAEELVVEATINQAVPTVMTNGDIFVPVLYTTTIPKDQLLIDGVNVAHTKRRTIYRVTGCIVLAIVAIVTASIIATRWLVYSGYSKQTLVPLAQQNNATTLSPTEPLVRKGNTNWTIADHMIYDSQNGDGLSLVQVETGVQFLQSVLNRTGINMTYFQVSQSANLLQSVDTSLITKFISSHWTGHAVSDFLDPYHCSIYIHHNSQSNFLTSTFQMNALKNGVVEGLVLDVKDIYDGMVVTSMAGYPLTFQINPLRMNNFTISTTSNNMHYKNGVVHTILEYPKPVVPWLGKTILDIINATNIQRQGDLTDFMAFIAITPDIQALLGTTSDTGRTLFVPTNQALVMWNLKLIQQGQESNSTMIQQLIQNHVVESNFVHNDWQRIPTGTQLSDNELRLTTLRGQLLDLVINDESVIINGDVTVVQGDLFSEDGIIHIINKVL